MGLTPSESQALLFGEGEKRCLISKASRPVSPRHETVCFELVIRIHQDGNTPVQGKSWRVASIRLIAVRHVTQAQKQLRPVCCRQLERLVLGVATTVDAF
jgi:hypothetical protein